MDTADPQAQAHVSRADGVLESASGGATHSGVVELGTDDLPAYCPNPKMPLWSWHPRVFLDVVNESEAMCSYCGTRYRLKPNSPVHGHGFGGVNLHQYRKQAVAGPEATRAAAPRVQYRGAPNVAGDASGNTRLELISRWLTGRWRS